MPKRTCGSHATLDLWLNIEVIDHALSWARQQHHSVIHTATNTNNPYATACFWFCPCCIEKLYTLPCNQPFTPISSIRSIARSACCIFLHFLPVAMEASLALIHVPTIPLQGKAWSWMVIFSARRAMQRSAFSTTRRWREGGIGMDLPNPSSVLRACSLHGLDRQEDRALVRTSCGGDGILPLLGPHVHLFVPPSVVSMGMALCP